MDPEELEGYRTAELPDPLPAGLGNDWQAGGEVARGPATSEGRG